MSGEEESKIVSLRAAGNEFFKAKSYEKAVEMYTEAIAVDPELQTDDIYKLFSNRSGAYSSLKQYKNALADADQCVDLKRLFGKGYTRKGDALFGLTRYKEAIKEYEMALTMEEVNKSALRMKIDNCKKAKSSGSLATRLIGNALVVANVIMLFTAVLGLLPTVWGARSFYMCLRLSIAVNAGLLLRRGRPKFSKDYLIQVVQLPEFNSIFVCALFMISRPFFLGNAPQAIRSAVYLCNWTKAKAPSMWKILSSVGNKLLQQDCEGLIATMEVLTALIFTVEILTPARNLIVCAMYWQLMRVRYIVSLQTREQHIVRAFGAIKAKFDQWFLFSSWCPSFVGLGYSKIMGFMASMVDPEQAKSSSKCNIM